jgi:hypothetical protein
MQRSPCRRPCVRARRLRFVSPDDVPAEHAALLFLGRVVGAVEGEVAQGGELGLNAVEPGAVGRGVGVLARVQGGEQMPDPMWAGVGGPLAWAGLASGVLVLPAAGGPLPAGCGCRFNGPNSSRRPPGGAHAQALVADVLDHPSATRKSASLAMLQVGNGRSTAAVARRRHPVRGPGPVQPSAFPSVASCSTGV